MTSRRELILYFLAFPAGHAAVDWGSAALWLLAPPMALALGLSPAQVGFLFTAKALGAGLTYLPAGILGDRSKNSGRFLMTTFWWVAASYLAASVATGYWLLVVLLAVASAGAAAWHPPAMGAMVQRMPERRAMALAIHGAGGTVAEVLAPLAVGLLLSFLDWRQVLQAGVIPAVLMGLLFLWLMGRVRPFEPGPRVSIGHLVGVWRRPAGLSILGILALHSMSIVALYSMVPLYLTQVRGFSSPLAALAFSAMVLCGAVVAPFLGQLSDRMGRRSIVLIGLLGGSMAVGFIPLAPEPATLVLAMVAGGLLLIGVRAVLMAAALEMGGRRESTVLGFLFLASEGLGAGGATLAGLVGNVDLAYALFFSAALALLGGGLALRHRFGAPAPVPAS